MAQAQRRLLALPLEWGNAKVDVREVRSDVVSAACRCPACRLPVTISRRRRELLQLVADGRWYDSRDADIGRLESLAQDGLIFWIDYKPTSNEGALYRITERGREILEAA